MAELNGILSNIDNYNDRLFISQVVIFFKRHDTEFTKSMIQHYVKLGVLPPPVESRYYTKDHLFLLALINELKEIYPLDEIKVLFEKLSDLMKPEDVYRLFLHLREEAFKAFNAETLKNTVKNMDDEKNQALYMLLAAPSYSKIIKNIISDLWDTI